MQTDIYYRDITKTENLEDYLMERIEGSIQSFFKYDSGAHLTVRVETDRHRSQTRQPSYICEVILKPGRGGRTGEVIKVRKGDETFKRCVAKTVAALKTVLERRSSKKHQHRRNDPMIGHIPEMPEPTEDQAVA